MEFYHRVVRMKPQSEPTPPLKPPFRWWLTERKVGFDSRLVGFMNTRHLTKMPFTLRAFGREQMTPGRLGAQNFAAAGDLKSFRDRFARLAARNWLRHEARKIDAVVTLTTSFDLGVECGRLLADC
jgi:hypothetical protein